MDMEKDLKKALEEILGKKITSLPKNITFPIRLEELLLKLEPKKKEKVDLKENGEIDLILREWKKGSKIIQLTEKEIDIVKYLAQQEGEVTKEQLLQDIFKYSPDVTTHTIETHIYRLRQKMKKLGMEENLQTRKEGYILVK